MARTRADYRLYNDDDLIRLQQILMYWVLRNGAPYQQQRQDLERQQRESLIRHHLHRLAQLGHTS